MTQLNQHIECGLATPEEMDNFWAQGWRHFGKTFFRYPLSFHQGQICLVMPLRVDLERFYPSRSQKRILARNRDLEVKIQPTVIDREKEKLFLIHRERFQENIPNSLLDFLSEEPASFPCENKEISVFFKGKLVAANFLDVGRTSASAVYAMFDPAFGKRSLGIFTILLGINYSKERSCRYYYPGYAYSISSFYDYKKKFSGLEYLDWRLGWTIFPREVSPSRMKNNSENENF